MWVCLLEPKSIEQLEDKMKPLRDRVVVKKLETKDTTSGGIIVTGAARKTNIGKVVRVGTGRASGFTGDSVALEVEVGDVVMFIEHSEIGEIDVDGEKLLLFSEDSLLAVLEDGEY